MYNKGKEADFAVDVAGDSMEPLYSDGDTVLVHAQPAVNEGEIGLYVYRGDGYIKRQGDDRLHSLNPPATRISCRQRATRSSARVWCLASWRTPGSPENKKSPQPKPRVKKEV